MDVELVTDSSSMTGSEEKSSLLFRYTKVFEDLCGFYMAIGMTYHEYWDGDCTMVKYFRDAHRERLSLRNYELYLQGVYIYEALLDASPAFNAFAKDGRPTPYREEPYPLFKKDKERSEKRQEKDKIQKSKNAFEAIMASVNAKFKEKGGTV